MNVRSRPSTSRSGAAVPRASVFAYELDLDAVVAAVVEHGLDQVREIPDAEGDVGDPTGRELADDELENRAVADRHQRLRQHRRVGSEPRALSAREDNRLHAAPAASGRRARRCSSKTPSVMAPRPIPAGTEARSLADAVAARRGFRARGVRRCRACARTATAVQARMLQIHRQRAPVDVQQVERRLLRKQPLDVVANRSCSVEDLALLGEGELAEAGDPGLHRQNRRVVVRAGARRTPDPPAVGPTSVISPLSTFQSCGSSSIFVLARTRPTAVNRSSALSVTAAPAAPFVHLPELQHLQLGAAESDTSAAEEDGAATVELDRRSGDDDDRQADEQERNRHSDVDQATDERREPKVRGNRSNSHEVSPSPEKQPRRRAPRAASRFPGSF